MASVNRVIILDRDGVINVNRSTYVQSPAQLEILPGVPQAIHKLNQRDYKVLVATNQACIGKGIITPDTLTNIHKKLYNEIGAAGGKISAIYHCPHTNEDNCNCRKPKPGMLLQACKEWNFNPQDTWFVGDTARDMAAAKGANCKGAFVLTGLGEEEADKVTANPHFKNLPEFVDHLLQS
ncbi:MAG: D-glycero-beta-D-manno-heptose 1,7-bisphosphate 7-phosphatase [Magnetococcales bacterium]|nr:D-glycero-beta-D-manno-heptose 1,7-bisphosphate 7-phosphatase [Magnetococcales bacterium]